MCWTVGEVGAAAAVEVVVPVGKVEVAAVEVEQEVRAVEVVGIVEVVEFVGRVGKEPGLSVQMSRGTEISK